jgi:hypothetical protein
MESNDTSCQQGLMYNNRKQLPGHGAVGSLFWSSSSSALLASLLLLLALLLLFFLHHHYHRHFPSACRRLSRFLCDTAVVAVDTAADTGAAGAAGAGAAVVAAAAGSAAASSGGSFRDSNDAEDLVPI